MAIDTIGAAEVTAGGFDSNVRAYKIIASDGGALVSVGQNLFSASSGNIRTAIYADNAGVIGALLAESASAAAAAGWNDLSVTGVTIVAGTAYWLAFQLSSATPVVYYTTSSTVGPQYRVSQAYGPFPASVGIFTSLINYINLRMTYTPPPPPMVGPPSSNVIPILTIQQW